MRRYRDPEWLRGRYAVGLALSEIADECGVNRQTIEKWAERHGIETGYERLPPEAVVEDVLRLSARLGRPPKRAEYESMGRHDMKTVERRFGHWEAAVSEALR